MWPPLRMPPRMPRLLLPTSSRSPVRPRALALTLAAACAVGATGALGGCDNPSDLADRDVATKVEESRSSAAPREGELPTVPASLTSAIGVQGASPAT